MDYYQGVVTEYLRANRATFVNMECLIQLEPGDAPAKGTHWYCDAIAVNLREKTAQLCEITYSKSLNALVQRLNNWSSHWPLSRIALERDCAIPTDWHAQPRVFIPKNLRGTFEGKFLGSWDPASSQMPMPLITDLETVVPWAYRTWDRLDS